MTKNDIASYLVSLHTLLDAQSKGSHSIPSNSLADEYEKHWELLKEAIQKENEDEARQSQRQRTGRAENPANLEGSEPGRRSPDWARTNGEIG